MPKLGTHDYHLLNVQTNINKYMRILEDWHTAIGDKYIYIRSLVKDRNVLAWIGGSEQFPQRMM